MAKPTFDTLSADIKALIVDEVLRPTDLVSLCLTSKQLHEIAVKPLYRYIDLDIGSSQDGRLTACFSPRNIGVKHIRSIHLYLSDQHTPEAPYERYKVDQAHLITRMILELLPEDILERFSWCPWKPFKVENLLLLYRRQRKLKNIEVIGLDQDFLPIVEKDEKLQANIFTSARKLFLYPEDRAGINLSGLFVRKTAAQLEELTIHTNFKDVPDPFRSLGLGGPEYIEPRELHDSATRPGLLTRTVFSHQVPFDKCEPFKNLASLSLHQVSVRQAAETWCKIIDFKKIEYLHLYQCTGADALIGQLCKAASLPKRLKAFSLQHVDNTENETLLALDGFLCLVSGIRDLIIDLINTKALPGAAGIARHGKTLETLNVHAWKGTGIISPPSPPPPPHAKPPPEELSYKQDDMDQICKACKGLIQLSIAFPSMSISRPPTGNLDAMNIYVFTVIRLLRHLVTLNISSWPLNSPALPRSIYETLLQAYALRLFNLAAYCSEQSSEYSGIPPYGLRVSTPPEWAFKTSSTPKLRLIAFGISDRVYERQDSESQNIYLRSTCQDAEGKTRLFATPVGWCLKQFVEPASDVLNTSLLRIPKPPFSGMEMEVGAGWGVDDEVEIVDD